MEQELVVERKALQKAEYRNDVLKIIAMATMLIDHVGYMFFPGDMMFRTIGRLAFPIFAYQIAVGYSKTSNLKKYVERLLIFALITQIPYSFFNPELKFAPIEFNVLFMFLAAIGVLYVYDMGALKIKSFIHDKIYKDLIYGILIFICTFALIILPEVIGFFVEGFGFEYGALGLAIVLAFHIFEENKAAAIISIMLLYLVHGYYFSALYISTNSLKEFWKTFFDFNFLWKQITYNDGLLLLQRYYFNARGVFALILIYQLQGIDTSRFRLNKYVAYIFYPAHIALIVIIGYLLRPF